MRGMERKS